VRCPRSTLAQRHRCGTCAPGCGPLAAGFEWWDAPLIVEGVEEETMAGEAEPISAKAREAIERDLAQLRAERAAVAATLHDTDSTGDRADQADELQRAEELSRLDDRIEALTLRLKQATIAGPPDTDVVGVGSTVSVRFADGSVEQVEIGEVAEELDRTLVTADSPLGRALLGRRAGDVVEYDTPQGPAEATVVSLG
jgi:transcription elongation GreA/GreB family factor